MSEVKDVFQRLLNDGPPMSRSAGEVLSTARGSRNRRRGLMVSAMAGLAVVAIGGSVALIQWYGGGVASRDPARMGQAAAPGPSNATAAPEFPPQMVPLPLRFTPGWVPPGWAEYGRMGWAGQGQDQGGAYTSRIWSENPKVERGEVKGDRFELSFRKSSLGTGGGSPVDINGRQGWLLWDDGKSSVEWPADEDTIVGVTQWGNRISQADLLRIARAVRPDPGLLNAPLRVGPVPQGFAPAALEIAARSAASWHASLTLSRAVEPDPTLSGAALKQKGSTTRTIIVAAGTETLAPQGGQPTTIGGRPARYVVDKVANGQVEVHYLIVELGNGLLLTVSSSDTGYDHVVQVAEGVIVEPAPDLAWIGPGPR